MFRVYYHHRWLRAQRLAGWLWYSIETTHFGRMPSSNENIINSTSHTYRDIIDTNFKCLFVRHGFVNCVRNEHTFPHVAPDYIVYRVSWLSLSPGALLTNIGRIGFGGLVGDYEFSNTLIISRT